MTQAFGRSPVACSIGRAAAAWGGIIVDLFKYGIASLGALALDAGTMVFLNKALGVNYLVAAAIGFTSGLGLVYWLSVRYVFGDIRRLRPSQEIFGFLVTGLIGLAAQRNFDEDFRGAGRAFGSPRQGSNGRLRVSLQFHRASHVAVLGRGENAFGEARRDGLGLEL